jgi:hypothetical protein
MDASDDGCTDQALVVAETSLTAARLALETAATAEQTARAAHVAAVEASRLANAAVAAAEAARVYADGPQPGQRSDVGRFV